jgi:DNA-binding transcriptional LysR family regulator
MALGTAVEVLARVESGAAALGISYKPLVTTAVEQRKIATESLVLIAAKGAARPRIRDVSRQRFVTYWEFEYVFDAWFRAHAMPPPTRWQRADHVEELEEAIEAVAAGRGLCIVPLDAAQSPAFRTRVMVLEHAGRRCRNDLYLLASPERVRGRDADLLQHAARKRWRG